MNVPNPYAPPKAAVADPVDGESEPNTLATRRQRAWAATLDSLIALLVSVPLEIHFKFLDYVLQAEEIPIGLTYGVAALSFVLFMLLNAYFLNRNGQTIGKLLVGIRIATLDGAIPDLWRIIGLRYALPSFAALLPYVGFILYTLDVLFVYRADRRCIHDLIAGTQVLRVVRSTAVRSA
jgi:uncharacterized RDD family membrane protein YckC